MGLTRPKIWDIDTSIQWFNDPLTVLHQGATQANVDVGFLFNRANGLVSNVAIYWNEAGNTFVTAFTSNSGSTDTNVTASSYTTITSGNLLPGANVTYSLGTTTQRWKDLWLSGSTIYLGGGTISAPIGAVTITNDAGGSFSVTGSVPGQASGTFGNLIANAGVASTSTSTGALQVIGGAGISGNVNVGSNATISGTTFHGIAPWAPSGGTVTDAAIVMPFGQWGIYSNVSTGGLTYARAVLAKDSGNNIVIGSALGTGMFGNVNLYPGSSTSTGAFNVFNGSLTSIPLFTVNSIGNTVVIANNQTTTSSTTGALIVGGGVGIGNGLFVSGVASLAGGAKFNTLTSATPSVSLYADGTQTAIALGSAGTTTTIAGNLSVGNLSITGNITSVNYETVTNTEYVTTLQATNVYAATIGNIGANHVGTGTYLTSLSGSNVTGTVPSATTAQYVTGLTAANVQAVIGSVSAGSFPTLNQNTTGTAATVTAASQPSITTLAGLTSFGTAGVNTSAQGNLTVGMYLTVPSGSGQFSGPYNESTTTSGVFVGNTGSGTPSPRIGFFNGTTAQNWQIDNFGGTFRWFTPGLTRMQLDTNGNLTVNGLTTISPGSQSVDSALVISGNVYKGGVGYHDFMRVTNQYSGATNPSKFFRLSSDGQLQIINSAYTNNLFNLTDGGDTTIAGKLSVGTGIFWSGNGNPISTGGGGGSISGLTSYSANSSVLVTYTTSSTNQTSGAFQVMGGIGVSGNVWAGQVYATNNGNGTNFAVGDDVWLGDINVANTSRIMGQQDATQGYLVFGNSNATNYIGRSGTNPLTVTGAFNITGNTAITNTLYAQGIFDNGNRVLSTSSGTGNLSISGTAITLPATGPGAVSTGSGSAIPVITTDAYGRISTISTAALTAVTNLSSSGASNITVSAATGTVTLALPATGPGAASVGSSTAIPVITTDAYGRISATSTAAVVAPAGTLSGGTLASGVTASSLTSLGNLTSLAISGTTSTRGGKNIVTNFTGSAAPANPVQGDEWYNSSSGVLYKYIYDGTSNNWINISSALTNSNVSAVANTLALRDSGGNLTATNFLGVASSAKYADLAEIYASDAQYTPGTVVVFGGAAEITVTNKTHDTRVAGVISTNPAYLMNSEASGLAVAFTGRVPCLVKGPVTKGDVLVTSADERYAERMDDALYRPGCILGKALGEVADKEFATIEVVVGRF